MWSRRLLPGIFILLSISTFCKRPCDQLTINNAQEIRLEAFQQWESSLNYMDAGQIANSRSYLDSILKEHAICIPYDQEFMSLVDSVGSWHTASSPKSEELLRSMQFLDTLRQVLTGEL